MEAFKSMMQAAKMKINLGQRLWQLHAIYKILLNKDCHKKDPWEIWYDEKPV
jgi:hypothetical protein